MIFRHWSKQRKSAKILKAANELEESCGTLLSKTDELVKSQFEGESYENAIYNRRNDGSWQNNSKPAIKKRFE